MVDVGLWEVALPGVIAMVVVGPDRLPKLATTVGRWTGKVRRMAQTIQRDIDRQIALEDQQKIRESVENVRKQLNQDVMAPLEDSNKMALAAESPAKESSTDSNSNGKT